MNQNDLTTATYAKPVVEIIETSVESGFASSTKDLKQGEEW